MTLDFFFFFRIAKMSYNNTTYDYDSLFTEQQEQNKYLNKIRMLYITGYLIICTLGLVLNLLVVIVTSCFHLESVTAKWILALAVTHLICLAFLPLQVLYSWYHFNWHYGTALCKLSSYVFYASLFSTAGLLTLWSVTDNIRRNIFNRRQYTTSQHSSIVPIMIMGSWSVAVVLSLPSLYSRELQNTALGQQCIDDYDLSNEKMTTEGKNKLTIVVWYRFVLGILIPAFLIGICDCCQSYNIKSTLERIKCLIKLAFFVCWSPLLIMGILQVVQDNLKDFSYALPIATVLAASHCCANPVIYLFMSQDLKMQWMKQANTDNW